MLERLVNAVGETMSGVSVVGEPGMGKSTLWRHGLADAARAGIQVLSTTCVHAERAMPYAGLELLLGDALDRYGSALPAPQRDALDGAFRCAQAGPTLDPRAAAAGAVTLLRAALDDGPVLLAVDDLHWADAETRACLEYALRRVVTRPVRLLITVRSRSPLWSPPALAGTGIEFLGDLTEGAIQTLHLGPLADSAIDEMLRGRLGLSLSPGECRRLATETAGNPLWALQFGARRDGRSDGGPPAGLDALIVDRIAGLERDAIDVACLVAALGRPRVTALLPAITRLGATGRPGEELLDEAIVGGVLTMSDGLLAPSHPLVGAALLAWLPPFRRRRLYRWAADLAESAEARALHLLEAASGEGSDATDATDATDAADTAGTIGGEAERTELVAALDEADAAARRRGAAGTAARFAARALELVEHDPDDTTTGEETSTGLTVLARRVALAELHHLAGDPSSAATVLDDLDLAALDAALLERAAPLRAQVINDALGPSQARASVRRLEEMPVDGLTAASLARREALVSTLRADVQCGATGDQRTAARRAVDQTVAAPVSLSLRRRALGALAYALLDAGEPAAEVIERFHALGPPDAIEPGRWDNLPFLYGISRSSALDLVGAQEAFATAFERQVMTGDAASIAHAGAMLAATELITGAPGAAEKTVARIEDHLDPGAPEPLALIDVRGYLHLTRGDLGALDELIGRLIREDDRSRSYAFVHRLRGILALQRGDPARAVTLFDRYFELLDRHELVDLYRGLWALADHAEALILAREHDRAQRTLDLLDDRSSVAALAPGSAGHGVVRGHRQRVRAQLAAHRDGALHRALALARDAVTQHERCPIPVEHGRSLLVLAEVHHLLGEADAAAEHRREAHDVFERIGYRRLADLTADSAPSITDVLTVSERAVTDLVAAGASNRAAAGALHLSVRTVETHLRSVYRKLGIRSRADLAVRIADAASRAARTR